MLEAQCLGLKLNTRYETPLIDSIDADPDTLGEDFVADLEFEYNNTPVHEAVPALLVQGWVIAPTQIHNYMLLTRIVDAGDHEKDDLTPELQEFNNEPVDSLVQDM